MAIEFSPGIPAKPLGRDFMVVNTGLKFNCRVFARRVTIST